MLETIFSAFTAFNQLGFMFGGLICLGLAVLIVIAEVQTRLRCVKVRGSIVAVRCGGIVSGMESRLAAQVTPASPPPPRKPFREVFKEDPKATVIGLVFAAIIMLVPLALFSGGAYFGWDYLHLKASGVMVQGKVAGIEKNSGGGRGGMTYSVVAAFTDAQGNKHEAKERVGTGRRPPWGRGSQITIFYDARNPSHFVIDAFWHNMALPFGLMGLSGGVMFFLLGWPHVRDKLNKRREGLVQEEKKFSMMEAVGRHYYPVYEYTTPNGETIRAHSGSGSNALGNKRIGTPVTLLVNPDEPWAANPPSILLTGFLALLFMVPAVAFLYAAFATFKFNIFTVIFTTGFLLYGGVKLAGSIKPRDQWEKPSEFRQRRREERRKKMENPGGHILTPEEFQMRLDAIDRYTLIMTPFIALAGIALLAGGFYLAQDMERFSVSAKKAQGEVVSLSRTGGNSHAYYPVVEFNAATGQKERFHDSFGSDPSVYAPGDKVEVLYDPAAPTRAKIDRGLFNNLPAIVCYGLGGLLLLWALRCWRDIRRRSEYR